jgi:hypothetical protein
MTPRVAAAVLLFLLSSAPAAAGRGAELRGTVTLGPTSPVCRTETPCERPYATRVVIRSARTGRRVRTLDSDGSGHFRARLRPGLYRVRALGGDPFPRCSSATVRVRTHRVTRVAISCDTGVR